MMSIWHNFQFRVIATMKSIRSKQVATTSNSETEGLIVIPSFHLLHYVDRQSDCNPFFSSLNVRNNQISTVNSSHVV